MMVKKTVTTSPIKDHKVAVELLLDTFNWKRHCKRFRWNQRRWTSCCSRGRIFWFIVIIDEDVVNKIDELKSLAPLHNPAHLTGYYAFKEAIPNAGAVAVFDTAFHQTLEPKMLYLSNSI